jgi:hypothetical protein
MLHKRNLLCPGLLLTGVLSLVLQYLSGNPLQISLFNSDGLYLPTLLSDLSSQGGRLADWYLTPAPYFFPDMPMFAVAHALGNGAFQSFLIFAVLQTLLLFFSLWGLARQIREQDSGSFATLVTLALVCLALVGREPFSLLFVSAYHYGAFLATLWIAFCWLKFVAAKSLTPTIGYRWLTSSAVVAFAAALSDNLFIVQALVPLLATTLVMALASRESGLKQHLPVLVPLLAGIFGSWSYKFLVPHPQRYSARLGLEKLSENVSFWWHLLLDSAQQQPLFSLALLIFAGSIVWAAHRLLRLPEATTSQRRMAFLIIFSTMSIGSALATISLLKSLPISPRYLIPVVSWPVVVAGLFMLKLSTRHFFKLATALSLLIASFLLHDAYRAMTIRGLHLDFYPADFACLDNALSSTTARNGIAQYWDAKLLQNFSRLDLNLAQYLEQLDEMRWITSSRFYRDTYDFAIISENAAPPYKLSAAAIERLNGPPTQVIRCGERSLYLYGKDRLKVSPILTVGESRQWRACELPTIIGTVAADCRLRKREQAQAGYLTFGPYQPVLPGRYRFDLDYISGAASTDNVGDWDVVMALEKEARVVGKGNLAGTAGATVHLSGEFVQDMASSQKIEVRTRAYADKDLEVRQLRLTRLN